LKIIEIVKTQKRLFSTLKQKAMKKPGISLVYLKPIPGLCDFLIIACLMMTCLRRSCRWHRHGCCCAAAATTTVTRRPAACARPFSAAAMPATCSRHHHFS
jgi:hypothetical protein